jgi:NADP-dependent 3-hydroxy acid dehydrogenase YdfG
MTGQRIAVTGAASAIDEAQVRLFMAEGGIALLNP